MSSFSQNFEDVMSNFGNKLFGPWIGKGPIVCVFCKSVGTFCQNLNIRFFHFFCVLLRIYKLQTHAAQVWEAIYPWVKRDQKQGFFNNSVMIIFGTNFE